MNDKFYFEPDVECPGCDDSEDGFVNLPETYIDNDVYVLSIDAGQPLDGPSWTGFYKHPRDRRTYKICKDRDGYLVTKPSNRKDSWGTGYSWRDVKRAYGLDGVGASRERHGNGCR